MTFKETRVNKILIIFILINSINLSSQEPDYNTDKTAFETAATTSGAITEYICNETYETDGTFTFTSKLFTDTDFSGSYNRNDLIQYPIAAGHSTETDADYKLCVYRVLGSNVSLPSYEFLKTLLRYYYFPSVHGHPLHGGCSFIQHEGYNADTGVLTFKHILSATFSNCVTSYTTNEAGSNKESVALWGPRFRYAPHPEDQLDTSSIFRYYPFPRILSSFSPDTINIASGTYFPTVALDPTTYGNEAVAHIVLQNFFSISSYEGSNYAAVDDLLNTKSFMTNREHIEDVYGYVSCEGLSGTFLYIAKGNNNCTYDATNFQVSCVDDTYTATAGIPDAYAGDGAAHFIGFCESAQGARYAYFSNTDPHA